MYDHTHLDKQPYQSKGCQRQFVESNDHLIDDRTGRTLKGCCANASVLSAICRAMQVSMTCLMYFAASIWEQTPADLVVDWELLDNLTEEELQDVELQVDEMWSFVGRKMNKRWIWVICCPAIKHVLAFYIGGRGKEDAQRVLDKLPDRLRENCLFATDYWEAYYQTIPKEQHRTSKALTYHIECYFTGVRARVSRLVRRRVSLSKKLTNHVAAIGNLFWQRNLIAHHYLCYTANFYFSNSKIRESTNTGLPSFLLESNLINLLYEGLAREYSMYIG